MSKFIHANLLLHKLQADFDDAGEEFIKVRDEYREHQKNQPLVFGQREYWNMLLDDLVMLSGIEKKMDTLDYVIKLIKSGDYDSDD